MSEETKRRYLVVGIVAAAVSVTTAAYVFWHRNRLASAERDSVDALLDKCHDQVSRIEARLGELSIA